MFYSPHRGRDMGPVGPAAARPLLVLGHGLWSDARVFRSMVRKMRSPTRVVTLDFPGHGTRAGEAPAQSIEAVALEYLDAIPDGSGPAVLGGISMGAVAAIHAALLRPEAVAGLILFAGTAAAEPLHRRILYKTLAHIYPHFESAPPMRWAISRAAFDPIFDLETDAARDLIRWAEGVPQESVAASLRLMADRPSVLHRLNGIAVPVAVVAGENDRIFPPVHSRELGTRLPKASVHILPDTGHGIVAERPAAAARLTDQLLARTFKARPVLFSPRIPPVVTRREEPQAAAPIATVLARTHHEAVLIRPDPPNHHPAVRPGASPGMDIRSEPRMPVAEANPFSGGMNPSSPALHDQFMAPRANCVWQYQPQTARWQ